MYAMSLEAENIFVRQCDMVLLYSNYFDPAFFIVWFFFCLSQPFELNIYIMFNRSTNVSTLLNSKFIKINIFYAFILDNNFCFFEHANELIHVQIHLTSFIELTVILNQT